VPDQRSRVHYVEHGSGVPLVALHGAGVDHREIEAAIEAIVPGTGYRRIYPDLPGMGRSAADGLTCNDDVVRLLGDFLDRLGAGSAMLLGHSYGAYLARGVAAWPPDTVLGLALLCPVAEQSRNVPDHDVVRQDADAYDELEPAQRAGFDEYFVVRTPATARRYRDHVVPGTTLVERSTRCGTPTCRCHTDPNQLHRPYPSWIRKADAKTVTRTLSREQLDRYEPLFDNTRRLRELINELETLAVEVLDQAKADRQAERRPTRSRR
jgi:pimeloyl-ACP methyl ester carboxylesterase